MKIPFVDLKEQYKTIKTDIDTAIQNVIDETAFVRGKYVTAFEEQYAKEYGVRHCISCANGTDAIYISLKALGIGPGDEVITTALSWISTSETITQAGARVVFVDIEPDVFCIDPAKIEEKITEKTKAIIPVHLYGQPADMALITRIAKKHSLYVIEDCAQAHFATYAGKKVGTFGVAGTFSFFPGKNLGAYGDAGAIITNDDDFANKARMFANHGAIKKHHHHFEGINSRMDGLQAAILSVKLRSIHRWNERRRQNAALLSQLLKRIKTINIPIIRGDVVHVFHLYVIRAENRDGLRNYLHQRDIATGIHYPTPLPFMPAYSYLEHEYLDFPVAAEYMSKIISLPMFPELSKEQIDSIAVSIKEFYGLPD